MIGKSKALEDLYYEYTHLALGGKLVRCPYWSNRQRILLAGPFKGKGLPKQIMKATKQAAIANGIDLHKLSSGEIRKFMEHHRIGVDCSGFVYHMADALDKEKGGRGILETVAGVKGKGPFRVNAFCLTSQVNSREIKTVAEIQIGDFLRLNAGKHIAIVLRLKKDTDNQLREVVYAHSGRLSGITGVHTSRFLVKKMNAGLEEQQWLEKNRHGEDYFAVSFQKNEGDGIKRLKAWD